MKKLLFIAFILAVAAITSCTKHYTYKSSYVRSYYVPEYLTAQVDENSPYIKISVSVNSSTSYGVLSIGDMKEAYNKYAEYYEDTNFQRDDDDHGGPDVSCNPLAAISVTCDRDWDLEHPAGTLLNDLIATDVMSVKKQIESGYKETNHFFNYNNLTEIDYNAIRPFTDMIYLYMPTPTDKNDKYIFTISVSFDKDPISGENVSIEPVTVEVEY